MLADVVSDPVLHTVIYKNGQKDITDLKAVFVRTEFGVTSDEGPTKVGGVA